MRHCTDGVDIAKARRAHLNSRSAGCWCKAREGTIIVPRENWGGSERAQSSHPRSPCGLVRPRQCRGTAAKLGWLGGVGYFRACSWTGGGRVAWILRLVKTGVDGEAQGTDLMEIRRPDGLGDIANLGLTLSEAKLVLANVL